MKYNVWIFCLLIIIGCGVPFITPTTLEKLRKSDTQQFWREARYDLVVMGHDAAVNLLIQTLADKNRNARLHAISFLQLEFQDARALPVLKEVFLHDADEYVQRQAAWALASIDTKYTADLMAQHLKAEAKTQNIAIELLSELKDARVIPALVTRLSKLVEQEEGLFRLTENGALIPEEYALPSVMRDAFALADFKDKRAIPVLLKMLTAKKFHYKEEAAVYLAKVGKKQAIPVILELLDSDISVSKVLQQFGPAVVPQLLEKLKQTKGTAGVNNHRLHDSIVDILKEIRDPKLAAVYGQLYFEALETEDWVLREAMIQALQNMGTAGMRTLINITQDPNFNGSAGVREVPNALSTYNNTEAVDAVAALALNSSFSHRLDAITTLAWFGSSCGTAIFKHFNQLLADNDSTVRLQTLHLMHQSGLFASKEAELSKHLNRLLVDTNPDVKLGSLWLMYSSGLFDSKRLDASKHLNQLLTDNDSAIRLRTIHLIQSMKLITMKPILTKLTNAADESIRDAAYTALQVLSGEVPLRLNIEISQQRYAYDDPIKLIYSLVNTSIYPVKVLNVPSTRTEARNPKDRISRMIEIQQPDGTLGKYVRKIPEEPIGYKSGKWVPKPEDYKTLQPGDKIVGTIPIIPSYRLYQSGQHTLSCDVPGWTLAKTEVHFFIEPPTAAQLNAMLARIDVKRIAEENTDNIIKACDQLGELRILEAIPLLKELASLDTDDHKNRPYLWAIVEATKALAKFSDPDLISMWIDFLNKGRWVGTAIEKAEVSGDTRAVKPLQRIAFGNMDEDIRIAAALALQKLGDSSGVEWFKRVAARKLRSRYPSERSEGVFILAQLYPQYNKDTPCWDLSTTYKSWCMPRLFPWSLRNLVDNPDPDIRANWENMNKKASNISGLKELLEHTNLDVQRAAAYELAYFGDVSGVDLIQRDLDANEAETRMGARNVLTEIQTGRSE